MDAKELAAELTGIEYPVMLSKELRAAARTANLVIVCGSGGDLMEFDGAIFDEVGAYDGGVARVDAKGIIPDFDDIDKTGWDAKNELRDYFQREGGGKSITAVWSEGGCYWTYVTDIPHSTFEVMKGDDTYCHGIVFSLSDL